MNWNEARSEAVLGARITAPTLGEGWFVDYQFNGMRIVTPNGSHSGFRPTPADLAADWTVDAMEPAPRVFMRPEDPSTVASLPTAPNVGKWGLPLPRIELGEAGVPTLTNSPGLYLQKEGRVKRQWGAKPTPYFEAAKQVPMKGETKLDSWGKPVMPDVQPALDKWGKPI